MPTTWALTFVQRSLPLNRGRIGSHVSREGALLIPHRPTTAEIDLDALEFNYRQVRRKTPDTTKILAVVKADGYGHGAVTIAKELQNLGVDLLGVAICEEGIALRRAGILTPIIVLNGIFDQQAREVVANDLTPVIFDVSTAQNLSAEGKRAEKRIAIHVKIDTGMGRVGVLPADIDSFFRKLVEMENLDVEGVLSHLSTADGDDREDRMFSSLQLRIFEESLERIRALGFSPRLTHLANSAATMDSLSSPCNLVRPGLILYGVYPSLRFAQTIKLKPVMTLKTEVIQVKRVPRGFCVSYGRTFITTRESIIATLPIGYADGYRRLLSNKGEALIRGEKVPVVGTVCMDMIMVDVTKVPNVQMGDEAVLMGRQGDGEISAEDIAKKMQTISYEVFCGVSKRVPRVYTKKGRVIAGEINV